MEKFFFFFFFQISLSSNYVGVDFDEQHENSKQPVSKMRMVFVSLAEVPESPKL